MSRYWWVNQGRQFEYERAGGYVFAPSGGRWKSWGNIGRLVEGEVLFHYTALKIRSVGVVSGPSQLSKRPSVNLDVPASKKPAGFEDVGHLTPVRYFDIAHPIEKKEIDKEWRNPDLGPFKKNGDLLGQGGAYRLDDRFVEMLVSEFGERLPQVLTERV